MATCMPHTAAPARGHTPCPTPHTPTPFGWRSRPAVTRACCGVAKEPAASATKAVSAPHPAVQVPHLDPAAPLLFVINSAAGSLDIDAKRAVIKSALAAHG